MAIIEIEQKVNLLIKNHLAVNEVHADDQLKGTKLGADSLDIIELTMAIEEEFEIGISDKEMETWKAPKDIYLTVAKYVSVN